MVTMRKWERRNMISFAELGDEKKHTSRLVGLSKERLGDSVLFLLGELASVLI
jgi:hypothetical protein